MSFLLHSFCPTTIWTQNSITLQVPPHHVSVTGRSQSSVHLEGSDFMSCGLYWILFETVSSRTPQTLTSYKLTLCCLASVFRVQSLFLVCTTRVKIEPLRIPSDDSNHTHVYHTIQISLRTGKGQRGGVYILHPKISFLKNVFIFVTVKKTVY